MRNPVPAATALTEIYPTRQALSVEAGLSAEIIVVEWNPLPGKPRLVDELRPSVIPIALPDSSADAEGCPAPPVRVWALPYPRNQKASMLSMAPVGSQGG